VLGAESLSQLILYVISMDVKEYKVRLARFALQLCTEIFSCIKTVLCMGDIRFRTGQTGRKYAGCGMLDN
jgi:hypothetical protein